MSFNAAAQQAPTNPSMTDVALLIAKAHGDVQRWQKLSTLSVKREHHMFRDETPFLFQIFGEYATQRIYQKWFQPGGEVVWDGERAWSNDWGFRGRFSERFTTSIGFHLANMPWLILDSDTRLLSMEERFGAVPNSNKIQLVLEVELEADPVRKPRGYDGPRDKFGIIVDPDTFLIQGIIERRSYAGQLDMAGASPDQESFADIFVIDSRAEAAGFIWPQQYSLFSMNGVKYGEGRFYDYEINVPFEDDWMRPVTGDEHHSSFDESSSYIRTSSIPVSD
jgi:hypothetical protein